MTTVAVSQRVDVIADRGERRDALDQRLVWFLQSAGFVPVPVPNGLDATSVVHGLNAWLDAVAPRAIVLSGGNDIGTCPERDRTERRLLDYAAARELPALGICRGMQMMGVWAGASLKPVAGHVRVRHQLAGHITGAANSYHGLALASCPAAFTVLAQSEDAEIEAIGHTARPWEGWMWHPEREPHFADRDVRRASQLLGA